MARLRCSETWRSKSWRSTWNRSPRSAETLGMSSSSREDVPAIWSSFLWHPWGSNSIGSWEFLVVAPWAIPCQAACAVRRCVVGCGGIWCYCVVSGYHSLKWKADWIWPARAKNWIYSLIMDSVSVPFSCCIRGVRGMRQVQPGVKAER